MTDGSFKTMPRPFMYTSVFAVPRSIARSRATSAPSAVGIGAGTGLLLAHPALPLAPRLGRQRIDVPAEADDLGVLARAAQDDHDHHDEHGDRDDDEEHEGEGHSVARARTEIRRRHLGGGHRPMRPGAPIGALGPLLVL